MILPSKFFFGISFAILNETLCKALCYLIKIKFYVKHRMLKVFQSTVSSKHIHQISRSKQLSLPPLVEVRPQAICYSR